MVKLYRDGAQLRLVADTYSLAFAADRPFVLSSVQPVGEGDDTVGVGDWQAS